MQGKGVKPLLPVVIVCLALAGQVGAQTLVYAPLPTESLAQTQASHQPLTDLLAALLDRPVEMRLYPDYDALLKGLIQGEVDFAQLGPLPLLLANERVTALNEVVTFREADGQGGYRCVIAAPVDGIQSLAELGRLAGRPSVALTRPESTCGPTVTFSLLAERGMDPALLNAQYRGGHDEVALAVLRQLHSVGGLKESVARRFHGLGLRILATSEPVPGFVLVSRSGSLAAQELERLRESLLVLTPEQLAGLQAGRHGFERFDEQQRTRLEAMRDFSAPYLLTTNP